MWGCGDYRGLDSAFTIFVTTLVVLSTIVGPVGASLGTEPTPNPSTTASVLSDEAIELAVGTGESIGTATESGGVAASVGATEWPDLDADDWGMAGRDPGRSGHNPASSGPKTDPDARWVYEFRGDLETVSAVASDGRVIVGGDSFLRAVDGDTGVEHWNVSIVDVEEISVADGVVVTTSAWDEEIRAYHAANGTERWNRTDFETSSSVIVDGVVYADREYSYGGPDIYALDLHDGTELWSAPFHEDSIEGVAATDETIYAAAMISADDSALLALNATDGSERWRFEMDGPVSMHPVVVGDSVYVGAGSQLRGSTDGEYDPKFYRLNRVDGHVEWIFDVNTRPNGAAVADGVVYLSSGNTIRALDVATGDRQWVYRLPGDITYGLHYGRMVAHPPAVADGVVYAVNDRGFAVGLDAATGDALWDYRLGGYAMAPAVADDTLYVHTTDDTETNTEYTRVYALSESPFEFSGLTASRTTVAPGEGFTVDVTVENVDDEARDYNLSLRADLPYPRGDPVLGWKNGTLAAGESTVLSYATTLDSAASWNLSVQRLLESEPSAGPVTVDVVRPNPDDRWSMGGFDANRSAANPNTDGPSQYLQEAWNASHVDSDVSPVVDDGAVYVVTHENRYDGRDDRHAVTAYDEATGSTLWEYNFTAQNRIPSGSPAVVDGTVYVVTRPFQFDESGPSIDDGSVYAIDASTGALAWTRSISIDVGDQYDHGPIVADGLVYAAGAVHEETDPYKNASVVALDAATGGIVWSNGITERFTRETYSTYAAGEGYFFAMVQDEDDGNSWDYRLHAYDAATGALVWTTGSGALDVDISETPVVSDGLVYVVDESTYLDGEPGHELVALDVATGVEAWRFTPSNIPNHNGGDDDGWELKTPVASDGSLYVRQRADADPSYSRIHRVDAATGEPVWNVSTNYLWRLQVVDGLIYAAETEHSPGYSNVYDAQTGELLGETGQGLSLSVANGTMYAYDDWTQRLRALVEGGAIEYANLSVDTHHVGVRENVTVTATATNVGDLPRRYALNLDLAPDDYSDRHFWDYKSRDGTLAPGESETISWTVRLDQRGDFVFFLQPGAVTNDLEHYEIDAAGSVTVHVGDDRDGSVVDLGGPRDLAPGADTWPKEGFDAGNTGNYTGTGAPTDVGDDVVTRLVNQSTTWDSGPTVVDETIFVGGRASNGVDAVLAVDATDGSILWEYATSDGVAAPPTYAGGYVYAADSDGRVYQLNAATGERLWTYQLGNDVGGITVVDDVAYVGGYGWNPSDYGAIHALNATTREVLWTFRTDSGYPGMSVHPAVEDGLVYVASDDGQTYALDATTGQVAWSRPIAGSNLHSLVVENGVLYADDGTTLYALDATTGDTIWDVAAGVDGSHGSSPALANDTLYFTADGAITAVDATTGPTGGDVLWSTPACAAARHSPVHADGYVFVPMDDSTIRAYDAATGDPVWRYEGYDDDAYSPAVVDGLLYATGLENDDYTYSLLALSGGTTDEPMTLFDYSGVSVSDEIVATGESLTVSATVQNLGTATCEYAADLRVDGTVVDTITGSAGPGSYNTETVEFTHAFDSTGTYDVTIEDLPAVTVNVTEPAPQIEAEPASYDYGDVEVGTTHGTVDFLIKNTGTAPLEVSSWDVTGPDADDFGFSYSGPNSPIAPGTSSWVGVWFAPSHDGVHDATITLATNATAGPFEIPLTGTGVSDSPPSPAYFEVEIDETNSPVETGQSLDVTVTVANVGDASGTQDVTLEFDGATVDSASISLESGDSTTETLSHVTDGTAAGQYAATVSSANDSASSTVEVTSVGNGMDGDGTETNPYVITDVDELQLMVDEPSAHYVLGNDIDASETATWNDDGDGPKGFESVGYWDDPFIGSLDGAGYEISDLYIDRRDELEVGLFGNVGGDARVEDVTLTNVDVAGKSGVGGLAGSSEGTLTGVSVTGTVTAGEHNGQSYAGGLAGQNLGTIAEATARTTVSGTGHRLGGLVGENRGAVTDVTVTASISALGYDNIGGLAGYNRDGTILGATATGVVTGENTVGGLVGGMDGGTVGNSTAGVTVTGNGSRVGGLVGNSYEGGFIEGSTASGTVTGTGNNIGGLVGTNQGDVSNVSASGDVVGGADRVGGLVGFNEGNVTDVFATGDVTGTDYTGGLIGYATYSTVNVATASGAVEGNERVGGLVGFVYQDSTIDNASAAGDVNGELAVGGLVGYASSAGVVTNAHANGAVTGTATVGGLVGDNRATVTNTYASGFVDGTTATGGLIGDNAGGSVVDSYWDLNATNQSSSDGLPDSAGRLTTELTGSDAGNGTVPGFDFVGNWTVTDDYPRLRAHVTDLAVDLGETELEADETTDATVGLVLFDGSTVPATEIAEYWSSDPSVATVSPSGLVTAIDDGQATIEAAASGLVAGVSLEVSSPSDGGLPPLPPGDGDPVEPSFVVSDGSLSATDVSIGETVTVSATIANEGGAAGTFTGTLAVDGTTVETVSLDLDPGQSDSVAIDWTPSAAGDFTLTLGGVPVGSITVSDADPNDGERGPDDEDATDDGADTEDESPAPNESDSVPGFSIVGTLLAIVLCVVVARRHRLVG